MKSPTVIRQAMRRAARVGPLGPWYIPQAFSFYFQDDHADYPTFVEYRCMVFTAVVNGAKGIWPFIYYDHFATPHLRLGVGYVFQELEELEPYLVSRQPAEPVVVQAPGDLVDAVIRPHGTDWVLLTVNLSDKETEATLRSDRFAGLAQLHGIRHGEPIKVTENSVTLRFQPYEVRLLAPRTWESKLPDVAQVQARIDDAVAKLRKPGNLLFGRGREIEWETPEGFSDDPFATPRVLASLTDGVEDCLGFRARTGRGSLRMGFAGFVPTFRRCVVYGWNVKDMDVYIWKAGDWVSLARLRDLREPRIEIDLDQAVRTVKLRLDVLGARDDRGAELYEIELYP